VLILFRDFCVFTFHCIGDYLAVAFRRQTVTESETVSVNNQPTDCGIRDRVGLPGESIFFIKKLVDLKRFCFCPCNSSFLQS